MITCRDNHVMYISCTYKKLLNFTRFHGLGFCTVSCLILPEVNHSFTKIIIRKTRSFIKSCAGCNTVFSLKLHGFMHVASVTK